MPTDVGPFELFYAGFVQHPMLLWLAALAAGAYCGRLKGVPSRMQIYCAALVVLSVLDAWLTSNEILGIGRLPVGLSGAVPLFFVLAGDFRYLLLVSAATPGGGLQLTPARLIAALGLTAIVPLLSQVLLSVLPASLNTPRTLYLVYELMFVVLTLCLLRFARSVGEAAWLQRVSRFVLCYYGFWATADVIILATGSDLGFALRVVPNLLYYGGLIAVIGRESSRAAAFPSRAVA